MSTAELDLVWRRPFELAWEALQCDSFPVGAVIVGPDGGVVAEGRNRMGEATAPHKQLAGSPLAHAEVNAIAQLEVGREPGYVLFTTLEPCLLCTGALRLALIDEVRYAAPDDFWSGIESIPQSLNDRAVRRWTQRTGPVGGLAELLGSLLPAVRMLQTHDAERARHFMVREPVIAIAETLAASGVPDSLDELIAQVAAASVMPTARAEPSG